MTVTDSQVALVVDRFPCFAAVPRDDWNGAELAAVTAATPHAIREGHMLEHAVFILSGTIRIYKLSSEGREVTLYRVHGGQCCVLMLASILGDMPYEASVEIETDAEALLLPVPSFVRWMDAIKPVKQYVYKQIMHRLTDVTKLLEQIAFRPIPYRLAELLLSARAAGGLRSTHERLAVELGTAREVVSRSLKSFESEGAIALSRGKIAIVDADLLERIMARHS